MKRVGNLFQEIISDENILRAIEEVNKTHRYTKYPNKNRTVQWVERTIDARVNELREMVKNGFMPSRPKVWEHYDATADKVRIINQPKLYPDQYVHHMLVQVIQPVCMRGMDRYACASIRGRGTMYGVNAIKKWMRKNRTETKYCLEMDIYHFYDPIDPKYVVARMKHLIKDGRTIDMIERITKDGIKIGFYTSQWLANTLLQPIDMMIHRPEYNVTHYIRYMDNFTIFGTNKRELHRLVIDIGRELWKIGLNLKGNWQVFNTHDRLPNALGYRYGYGYTLIRKKTIFRLKKQLSKLYKKEANNKSISPHMAMSILSRIGMTQHCNCQFLFAKYYRPKTQKRLKNIAKTN